MKNFDYQHACLNGSKIPEKFDPVEMLGRLNEYRPPQIDVYVMTHVTLNKIREHIEAGNPIHPNPQMGAADHFMGVPFASYDTERDATQAVFEYKSKGKNAVLIK